MADLQPITTAWSEAKAGDVLAVADDYEVLLAAIRRRKDELGFSFAELDERSGLPDGYVSKLLGPSRIKNLGPLSLGLMLEILGLRLAVVAASAYAPRVRRNELQVRKHKSKPLAAVA
jgi:hypothetical protein